MKLDNFSESLYFYAVRVIGYLLPPVILAACRDYRFVRDWLTYALYAISPLLNLAAGAAPAPVGGYVWTRVKDVRSKVLLAVSAVVIFLLLCMVPKLFSSRWGAVLPSVFAASAITAALFPIKDEEDKE
ncbi:MAG: hypothetical protein IJP01_02295 [Oscillospiraceae bacterium]|nr:hypothetical protein [Oscillospiraceae bacterium]